MIAFTPDRGQKRVETEQEVRDEFAVFDTHFMLQDDQGAALLATGQGFGPYILEWFPAKRCGGHPRADGELTRDEVLVAMLDYLRGGSAWRGAGTWQEVADNRPGVLDRLLTSLWRERA